MPLGGESNVKRLAEKNQSAAHQADGEGKCYELRQSHDHLSIKIAPAS